MAERIGTRPAQNVQQGTLTRLLGRLSQALYGLLFALLFSIVLEWLGMVFWWPDQGLRHSRDMLAAEAGYLQMDFRRSLVSTDPAHFAQTMADRAYVVLFEWTRLVDVLGWLGTPPAVEESGLRVRLHRLYQPLAQFILAALQITQVFALRLAILLLATPVFLLFGATALVDGLVRRDLRRWGGGRESSFVYHWSKRSALPLLVTAWVIYLALPFSLHPSWVILPFATLFAISIAITASSFKKYL
ncbi:MAG TPA: TIGR03747 family integrating conjugative element membrane protein [Halieaceae bacterium]|nr:TIGR03747 family integrating conjugative element membrane protein [Halieaceae bacterium]